jgi:RND family efflux transporter MFP subunit
MQRTIPLALAAWSALLAACPHKPADTVRPQAVKVATVEIARSTDATRYSAHVEPATRLELAFKVGGYVDTIAKVADVAGKPRILQEGDVVKSGQQLASLRKNDYVQRLAEARAAYEQAKAGVDQAELDMTRDEQLAKDRGIANTQLQTARTRLATARATLAGAAARVEQAATALSDTTLRAPLDATILRRGIEVGVLAAPGTEAFTLADVTSVKAVFAVPDTILPRVRLGAAQTIRTEAFPGVEFMGRITRISPSADVKNRGFEAEIMIPNADGRLKTGMVAALSLDAVAAMAKAAPLVPLSAVVRSPRGDHAFAVFVIEGDPAHAVARARDVELGEYLGRVIPVRTGLTGGERIVVQGAGLLSDGEAVEIVQ